MPRTANGLDIAHGYITDFGVDITMTDEAPDRRVLGFDTIDEVLTYLSSRYDTYNITVTQAPMRRNFTVWQLPWLDARGPEGETWTR